MTLCPPPVEVDPRAGGFAERTTGYDGEERMVAHETRQSRGFPLLGVGMALLLLGCGAADGSAVGEPELLPGPRVVRPGIDLLLSDSLHLVRGLRVGLITNPTGVDAEGTSTIDRLDRHPEVDLVTLFAPEHGLRAVAGEGQMIEDSVDPATGIPVVSLYTGAKRAPSVDDLAAIDAVLFDMQDIGARYYTYVYTMARSMTAAGEAGVPFIVLDRPNPIGGAVQGNLLDPEYATFIGMYPIPMRHGMTAGELARLFRGEFGVDVDLTVVPVEGWRAADPFETTALPWIPPSPNIPDLASARHYPGSCLFEGTNLSVGRGSTHPFQQVGAPWLDGDLLAERLAEYALPGVRFEAVTFTPDAPTDGKWAGETVFGVRLVETDPDRYDPTRAAVAALVEARRLSGSDWEWNVAHFDRLAGTDALRLGIESGGDLAALTGSWAAPLAAFETLAQPYRIYPR